MDKRHKKRRPPQNYTPAQKRHYLAQVGKREEVKRGKKVGVYQVTSKKKGPSKSTLYRWLAANNRRGKQEEKKAHVGRPPKLSHAKKLVLGGWVLKRAKRNKHPSAIDIVSFVERSFGVQVDKVWVSRAMRELSLSSHKKGIRKQKYQNKRLPQLLFNFLRGLHQVIEERDDLSSVVAVDTVRFTNTPLYQRGYAPIGGYVFLSFFIFGTKKN